MSKRADRECSVLDLELPGALEISMALDGSGPSTNLGMVFRLGPDGTATELAYFIGKRQLSYMPAFSSAGSE